MLRMFNGPDPDPRSIPRRSRSHTFRSPAWGARRNIHAIEAAMGGTMSGRMGRTRLIAGRWASVRSLSHARRHAMKNATTVEIPAMIRVFHMAARLSGLLSADRKGWSVGTPLLKNAETTARPIG